MSELAGEGVIGSSLQLSVEDAVSLYLQKNKAVQSIAKWWHGKLLRGDMLPLPILSLPWLPVTVADRQTDGPTDRTRRSISDSTYSIVCHH